MTDEQRKFLDDNRHHYDLLIRAQYVKHLDIATREGLLRSAKIFQPAYNSNLWCNECVAELLKFVYLQYDLWLARQQPSP